jgi:hypothetical protein
MYNLFLDDEIFPWDVTWVEIPDAPWNIVRSHKEFCEFIVHFGLPKNISFDHDLGQEHYIACAEGREDYGDTPTGLDCAKWLVKYCETRHRSLPNITIHSLNPVGRENIRMYFVNARKHIKCL